MFQENAYKTFTNSKVDAKSVPTPTECMHNLKNNVAKRSA